MSLPYVSDLTMRAVQGASMQAALKHPADKLLISPVMDRRDKLAALVEEVGEVARELTYDNWNGDPTKLIKELLQLSQVAASWAEAEDQLQAARGYMFAYAEQARDAMSNYLGG